VVDTGCSFATKDQAATIPQLEGELARMKEKHKLQLHLAEEGVSLELEIAPGSTLRWRTECIGGGAVVHEKHLNLRFQSRNRVTFNEMQLFCTTP
jgi:hypothetical protein